ncbi:MAG: zinc ribbon domain-containing protein [Verrucomicrobia bacterium]|nr:zinc ribbon domain-containing protein [Verrucomicrobiota bacterium]
MEESTDTAVHILTLTAHIEMGEAFVVDLCGSIEGGMGETKIGASDVVIQIVAGLPQEDESWPGTVKDADVLAILVRFMDAASLAEIHKIWKGLPQDQTLPTCMLIFREPNEQDFKMSCPACGQKLWVRDQDIGKRGRCPNCKKAFRLPRQEDYLKQSLKLPDAVPIARFVRGDHTDAVQALRNVVDRFMGRITTMIPEIDQEMLKKATMRVEIHDGDTSSDE